MPTKEDLIWADEQVQRLLDLSDNRTKTVSNMLDFNAQRYTLVYQLAAARPPF